MSNFVIKAEGLGKKFTIGHQTENESYKTIRDLMALNTRALFGKTRDLIKGKPTSKRETLEEFWALQDINFEIKPGETLAIVGATGSGKTSIISLINRFYTHQSGLISIDGTDIKDFDLQALRHKMALVLQDVFLFSGSVFENITLRDESISREKVLSAAKMIGAHEFIEKLPGGYDYQVMERGATLSMGQRQLISFVRALVFEPDILILDEATSSIDPASESVIQKAIETLIAQRTSIIIAHRLSTIMHAHKILVMQRGEVMESGSPEDLLKNEEGLFRKLHDMQFIQIESMVTSA